MSGVRFTVPLEPPSVNHYKRLRVIGKHVSTFVTKEAKEFMSALAVCAGGQSVNAKLYAVSFRVYQGKKSRGDVDNYSKCVLDGLVHAGVIHSDAAIIDLRISKERDWVNPRTEIIVRPAIQVALFNEILTDEEF
jgi:Holliday junction resolvase RusA-like endonuclease